MKKIISICIILAVVTAAFSEKKRIKNHITETKIASYNEFEIGSGSLKLKKFAEKNLISQDFSVNYNPRKNTANLEYKKAGLKERLVFDVEGRKCFVEAYKQYLKDYEEKKLNRKKTKFENSYGAARAKVEWGAFTYNMNAHPKMEFGYIFVGKSPYIAIRVHSIKSEESRDEFTPEYSGTMLYFTRSMAEDLASAITEENISNKMQELTKNSSGDDYDSSEEDYIEEDSTDKENTTEEQSEYKEDEL